ncbi:peptide deformylase [Paenibacillus physcomitrellae]|uniref:Peptide deformylase n=1 Tax=Paenibacillus physcomitrellae TaxID=1619311 RepID=A0ABQ1GUZ6_9BACL|nr:peptide deformylase [Paenibacillus physcomitrellae]GGA50357.1 peptide deformylase 2 [Paenibacillus physcomitrellae]
MKFYSDTIITMDDIVREGDPILRTVTEAVSIPPTAEDVAEMDAMMLFLKNSQDEELAKKYKLRAGVGLSANQIGLNKRMFAAYFMDEEGKLRELAMFNPKIISHSEAMTYLPESEGCLSVDRAVQGFVPRYEKVQIKAWDRDGEEMTLRFRGFGAIIMQHEIDHLNGIMFYDHINKENPYKLPANVRISSLY